MAQFGEPGDTTAQSLLFEVGEPRKPFEGIHLTLPESGIPLGRFIMAGEVPFEAHGVSGKLQLLAPFPGEEIPWVGDTPLGPVSWNLEASEGKDGSDKVRAKITPLQFALTFELYRPADFTFLHDHVLMLKIGDRVYYMDCLEEGNWSDAYARLKAGGSTKTYSMDIHRDDGTLRRVSLPFDEQRIADIEACFVPLSDALRASGVNDVVL